MRHKGMYGRVALVIEGFLTEVVPLYFLNSCSFNFFEHNVVAWE